MILDDRKYNTEHEWVKLEGGKALIGISDYAQSSLGDIVFIELPAVGAEVKAREQCGEIESVKSVSSLYAPMSGTVTRVNQEAVDSPQLLNEDPMDKGWLLEIEVSDPAEYGQLLDASAYTALTEE